MRTSVPIYNRSLNHWPTIFQTLLEQNETLELLHSTRDSVRPGPLGSLLQPARFIPESFGCRIFGPMARGKVQSIRGQRCGTKMATT